MSSDYKKLFDTHVEMTNAMQQVIAFHQDIENEIKQAYAHLFSGTSQHLRLQRTSPEHEGTHTLICFPLAKECGKSPHELAQQMGKYLVAYTPTFTSYNVVKGFLNLFVSNQVWLRIFDLIHPSTYFDALTSCDKEIVIEFSSPNTNKPLHLGHLRNIFLGESIASIYAEIGYTVRRVQIVNDRGIHICKSMVAWQQYGKGETPESAHMKGDRLVGQYYVKFNQVHEKQILTLVSQGMPKERAAKEAPIMKMASQLLALWEEKHTATMELWKRMNQWVYQGFEVTYNRMGVKFDKLYYESDTYLLGKEEVRRGVEEGVFYKQDDGSVWVDLSSEGMDQKILLRSDGTTVYMTQDIGTALSRYHDFPDMSRQVYVVGSEQEYHFAVLFLILKKLGYNWASSCYHLSYGMVDLPSGKMKSREGTVVDADDLMETMHKKTKEVTSSLGKVEDMDEEASSKLFETIGMGALKYYLLRLDPNKRIVFDPNESIQLQGHTGPFIQYTYARIQSLLSKSTINIDDVDNYAHYKIDLLPIEINIVRQLFDYPLILWESAHRYSPAVLAQYVYDLVKEYNHFYQSVPVWGEADETKRNFRVRLSAKVGLTIKKVMSLLGIAVPDRM